MRNNIPGLFRVPFPYLFSNYILRTPCIGPLFLIFYIYTCLPSGTSSGWFIAISIVLSLLSFFTTLPVTFGTPVAFAVSLFFVSSFNEFYITVYLIVSLIAFIIFTLHYVVIHRLSTKRYLTLSRTGQVIVNPDWVEEQLFPSLSSGRLSEFQRDRKEQRKKSDSGDMGSVSFWVLLVLGLVAIVVLGYFIMQGNDTKTNLPVIRSDVAIVTPTSTPRPTATPRRTAAPAPMRTSSAASPLSFYYQMNYPMTWGYISKYAAVPESYIQTYDRIWGDLQRYHGDGIPFDTLSRYEQSLVNYPGIGSYIYFASASSREYHSTVYCYTLLRSTPVQRSSRFASQYNPCSKCVGD